MQLIYNKRLYIFRIGIVFLFLSCNQEGAKEIENPVFENSRQKMWEVNAALIDQEEAIIERYIDRYGWEMNKTETGLHWMIYHPGNGAPAEPGKIAVIEYKTFSLDGRLLYSSDKDGKKSFLIGHGGVESGLEEAILFLKIGDKSRFVLPSHLAFGLTGDGNKIKGRNSLMMEVELIDLK